PAVKSARLALPSWIFLTRAAFVVVGLGTRHTLASYLSMHPAPDTTASTGHFESGPLGGPAAPAAPASSATASVMPFEKMCRMTRSFSRVVSCRSMRSLPGDRAHPAGESAMPTRRVVPPRVAPGRRPARPDPPTGPDG